MSALDLPAVLDRFHPHHAEQMRVLERESLAREIFLRNYERCGHAHDSANGSFDAADVWITLRDQEREIALRRMKAERDKFLGITTQ